MAPDRRERELLLGIFLMEAWDTAGALEEQLGLLTAEDAPSPETLAPVIVFAHRLKGSAALHGFPGVSDLAAATERLLERIPATPRDDRRRGAAFIDGLVTLLKDVFDGISAVGIEDAARIGEFKSRYPKFFAPVSPGSFPAAPALHETPAPPAAPSASPPPTPRLSPVAAELSRFFADSGEVLEYFLPEATEHLEAMTTALLALEGGAADDEMVATLFRSAHTLKGAAYTVGCAPIGDATHQIEDLLGLIRERRLTFTPELAEAVFAGTAAIKRVLQSGAAVSDETAQALERATHELRDLMASDALPEAPVSVPEESPAPVAAIPPVPKIAALPAAQGSGASDSAQAQAGAQLGDDR